MDLKTFALVSALLVGYLFCGGLLFQFLERLDEQHLLRSSVFDSDLPDGLTNWTETDHAILHKFMSKVFDFINDETGRQIVSVVEISSNVSNKTNNLSDGYVLWTTIVDRLADDWTLYNAFFYAETLLATVGFGMIATKTVAGRLVSCLYAVIGIPILGVWMNCCRENMFEATEKLRHRLKLDPKWRRFSLMVEALLLLLVGSLIFIFGPAVLFSYMEDWSYLASFYCK